MTTEDLKDALQNVPAGSFKLHLSEQSAMEVVHPDYVMFSPNGRLVTVWTTDRGMHTLEVPAIIWVSHERPAGVED